MSNFNCEICGAAIIAVENVAGMVKHVPGCEHLPPKPARRQHISARLDADLVAAIKERARTERRSTNNLIECLLFKAMAEKTGE